MKKGKGWAILLALTFLAHYAICDKDAARVKVCKTLNRKRYCGYYYWQYWYLMTPGGAAQGNRALTGIIEGILSCFGLLSVKYVYECFKHRLSDYAYLGKTQKLSDLTKLRFYRACAQKKALPSKSVKKESTLGCLRDGTLFLKVPDLYGAIKPVYDGCAALKVTLAHLVKTVGLFREDRRYA